MERILIVGCKRVMDDVCIACSMCLLAFNRKEGEFERYKGLEAELIGFLNCGDCPNGTIVTRLAQFKRWIDPMSIKPTTIHVGPCLTRNCPQSKTIIDKMSDKSGIPVIEGAHMYQLDNIFA